MNLLLGLPLADRRLLTSVCPQREQFQLEHHEGLDRTKPVPHRPFFACDVVLDEVELNAVVAQFKEPERTFVELDFPFSDDTTFHASSKLPEPTWRDYDDYVDTDWAPSDHHPEIELHQLGRLPRFTYKRRVGDSMVPRDKSETSSVLEEAVGELPSKFGEEDTHNCMQTDTQSEFADISGAAFDRKS